MPKRFPPEFMRDVVAIARSSGLTRAQVARDFGVSGNAVARWVKRPGPAVADDLVLRDFTAQRPDQVWLTSRSIRRAMSSSTCARSRTSARGASWAGRSVNG